ncbi:hypothetical protein BBJ28_00009281 [Nothophytophthora sp. Chile5]|nr:hypothetical protein BBJ28_00009281 [Nothophytophthora sp. Chile5]
MQRPVTSTALALVLLAMVAKISLAVDFTGLPVSSRLAQLVSAGVESPPLKLTTMVPAEVQYLLAQYNLRWSDLGGTLQRLLLWDVGHVVTASNTTRELQVRCGLGMDDLVVSRAEFQALQGCLYASCTDPVETKSVLQGTVCPDSQVKQVSKCAVLVSKSEANAASVNVETSMIWSEEGNNTNVPLPTVLRHSAQSFAITLQSSSSSNNGKCPQQLALVIPCSIRDKAASSSNSSEWCTPRTSGIVPNLLRELVAFRQQQEDQVNGADDSGAESSGVSIAIWVVAAAATAVLGGVVFLYVRRLRRLRDGLSSSGAFVSKSTLVPYPLSPGGGFYLPPSDTKSDTGSLSSALSELEAELEADIRERREGISQSAQTAYSDELGASQVLLLFQNDPVILSKRVPIMDVSGDKLLSRGRGASPTEVLVGRLGTRDVALKRLSPTRRNDTLAVERLSREIRLAASLEHPHVVNLVGVAWNAFQNLVAVWELQRGGTLRRALRSNRVLQCWTWEREKLQIAIGVLQGLAYLHSRTPSIVHGALEPRHILLDVSTGEPALCGLGNFVARTVTTNTGSEEPRAHDGLWRAPEVLCGHEVSEKSDVYSFGVVLVALDTGALLENDSSIRDKPLEQSLMPECPEFIRQIVRDCLQSNPDSRPTARELLFHLTDLERVSRPWSPRSMHEKGEADTEDDELVRALFCL